MALVISTKILQAMVDKLNKCSQNKLLEITKYWHLVANKTSLSITALDGSNYIKVTDKSVKGDMDVIIKADQFGKLVDKTSVDKITLELHDNFLRVVGNGDYKVEIVLGETFPFYEVPKEVEYSKDGIATKNIKTVITYNKSSASTTLADGYLTGYFIDDGNAVTSDSIKICINPTEVFDTPVLMSPEMMNLITGLTGDKFNCKMWENKILINDDTTEIYGAQLDGIEEFPDVMPFIEAEFPSTVKLSKLGMGSILDRLTLFLDSFDKSEITLDFTNDFLKILTNKGSFEQLTYANKDKVVPFTCSVNVVYFKDLITAVQNEYFELHFGDEAMIEIVDGEVIFILATGEMDEGKE